MAENFPLSFRNQTLRKHRQKILLERERSFLPAMQIFVEALRNRHRAETLQAETSKILQQKAIHWNSLRKVSWDYQRLTFAPLQNKKEQGLLLTIVEKTQWKTAKEHAEKLQKEEKDYYKHEYHPAVRANNILTREIRRWTRVYMDGADTDSAAEKEKRQFLMRCPSEGCRGFLSTAYKCGVCEKSTCSDCLEILPVEENPDSPHTCKPDNVESAKAIKKETRPCPKCAARIFKIDGCDQMWCTVEGCNTAFSWNSGHVVSGRVHNPHYYEWLRRNGGEEREVGDVPCGGVPVAWAFTRMVLRLDNKYLSDTNKNILLEIHRNVSDFEARLPLYPARPNATMNKDINVKYLMNLMTEGDWQMKLEHNEARFNRKKEIGQLLQTVVTATSDILQTIVAKIEEKSPEVAGDYITNVALPNLESLRLYTNGSYKKMGVSLHMAVPQINNRWQWTGIHAHYKVKNEIVDTPEVHTPEVVHAMDEV